MTTISSRNYAVALTVANVPSIKVLGSKTQNLPSLPSAFLDRFCDNILLSHTYKGHGRVVFRKAGSGLPALVNLMNAYWQLVVDRMTLAYLLSSNEPCAMELLRKGDTIGAYDQFTLSNLDRALQMFPMSGRIVDLTKEYYPILISLKGVILLPSGIIDLHIRIRKFVDLLRDASQWLVILQGVFGRPAISTSASVDGVRAALINHGYRGSADPGEFHFSPNADLIQFGYPFCWFDKLTKVADLEISDPSFFYSRYILPDSQIKRNLEMLADDCVPVEPSAGGSFEGEGTLNPKE